MLNLADYLDCMPLSQIVHLTANKTSSCSAKNAGSNLIHELEFALPSAISPLNFAGDYLASPYNVLC